MVDKGVVITYKRKRFSARSDFVHGSKSFKSSPKTPNRISPTRANPKVELDACDEKLNKDCSRCFKCGNIDVDRNLLRCGCCSKTHHFHCMDVHQKRKWQCSNCHRRTDSEESRCYDVGESRSGRKSKGTEETDMGPIELRSQKVLLSLKIASVPSGKSSCSNADSSFTKAADSIRMDCTDNNSCPSSKFMGLNDVKPDHIQLTSSSEMKYTPGCPKDSMMTLNSDKTNEQPKERCKTPLITFSRRAKRNCEGTGKFALWNSKPVEKQCQSTMLRGQVAGSNCNYEDSSAVFSFENQQGSADVILEHAEMVNVERDAGIKSTPVGGFEENKCATDGTENLSLPSSQKGSISSQNPMPAQPATNVLCSADISFTKAAATDFIKRSFSTKDDKQSGSVKIGNPVRKESRNKSETMDSDKTILLHDVSLEPEHPCEPACYSIAPPSTFVSNVESSKPSVDVTAENLLESQSSSAPSCPIVLADEGTDGMVKELEWLEDLDRVLHDKKNRNACSFIEQGGFNRAQTSFGRTSAMDLGKSESPQHMNQVTPSQGEIFLLKFSDQGSEKQQQDEVSTKSSFCTNFLGMSLPPNHGSHVGPIKDVHSMLLPSSSGAKGNAHAHNRHLPWNLSNETSFLLRHKQMVENGVTGTRMPIERQCTTASMFKKHSNEWSEEELDFLWIGVRRHGISNWNAMLRDPKLRFLESRVAEDLALQWDMEQRKLLNGTLPPPLRLYRADYSPSLVMDDGILARSTAANQYGAGSWSHASSEFPMLGAENKLSLGYAYHQNMNFFQPSGIGMANPPKSESSSTHSFLAGLPSGCRLPKLGIRRHTPTKAQNRRYDRGPSTLGEKIMHGHQSGAPSATKTRSSIPHWLKEVINTKDPGARGSSLPPVVAGTAHSKGLLSEDMLLSMPSPYKEPSAPLKDSSRQGIWKRKRVASSNGGVGTRTEEALSSPGVLPLLGKTHQIRALGVTITPENNGISNQNIDCSAPPAPSELAVFDGDASSEETISDDQGGRPS